MQTNKLFRPRRMKHGEDDSGKSRRAKQFRRFAELLNQSPAVQIVGAKSRPRRAARHGSMKV